MAIHLDIYTRINERDLRQNSQKIERTFDQAGDRAGRAFGQNLSAGIERSAPRVERASARMEKATDRVADAISRVRVEQAKSDDLQKKSTATDAQKIKQSEALARAKRAEAAAIREANRIHADHSREILNLSQAAGGATSNLARVGSTLGSLSRVGGAVGIAAVGVGLWQVTSAAAAAAQAVALLPAAAGAAGAAFGTLKIATLGFGDAMENLRDTEKFTEALKSLSPNAQQAALSIRGLLPAFDQLKNATQDALFANVGTQIEQLSAQYLPVIQQMTTGIAAAFNDMFAGVSAQLMTPGTSTAIMDFADNVAASFRNLAPALAPLTAALADLMDVGSSFLPELAAAASNAAASFAAFINDAKQSGELESFIRGGITALGTLVDIVGDLTQMFFSFRESGQDSLEGIAEAVNNVSTAVRLLNGDFTALGDKFPTIGSIFERMAMDVLDSLEQYIMNPLRRAIDAFNALPGVADIPQIPRIGEQAPGMSGGGGSFAADSWIAADAAARPNGLQPGQYRRRDGSIGFVAPPSMRDSIPGAGGTGGASGPRLPDAPVLPNSAALPPWAGPQSSATFSAESSYLDAQNDLAQKRARLAQLEQSTAASAADVQKARNDVLEAERDAHGAELRLNEARLSATEQGMKQMDKTASDLGQIGAQLDQDFGISKGLSGIAENITKFVANLAAAPLLGQLNAISAANPSQGGHGLFGIAAAQGAFGPNHTGLQQSYGYQASAMGPMPIGTYPGDAALLSHVKPGEYVSKGGVGDLTEGIGDCTSTIEDLVNILDGRPTAGRSMATGNAAEWLALRGFVQGEGGPGDFRVGYNSSHMQATLPGGTHWNWGSPAAAAAGGVGGSQGAYDPALTQRWYRPAGAVTGGPAYSAPPLAPAGPSTNTTPGAPNLAGIPSIPGGPLANGMPTAAPFAQRQYGGLAPAGGTGKGGVGMSSGGGIDLAIQAGGMAADMFAPGAGQAAQTGAKLINRAIEYGGQVAGIGANGLMETFLPTGGSALAGGSWLTKIAGGIAGAGVAIPNVAGGQPTPEQLAGQPAAPQQGGIGGQAAQINHQTTINAGKDRSGAGIARDFEYHTSAASRGPGM